MECENDMRDCDGLPYKCRITLWTTARSCCLPTNRSATKYSFYSDKDSSATISWEICRRTLLSTRTPCGNTICRVPTQLQLPVSPARLSCSLLALNTTTRNTSPSTPLFLWSSRCVSQTTSSMSSGSLNLRIRWQIYANIFTIRKSPLPQW